MIGTSVVKRTMWYSRLLFVYKGLLFHANMVKANEILHYVEICLDMCKCAISMSIR